MSVNEAYLQGTPCPNCGHVRSVGQPGPRWHCPHCHNEYPSLLPKLEGPAYEASRDSSLFLLLAANLVTIGATFWLDVDLKELLLIYWVQSVIIGISFWVRMVFHIRTQAESPFQLGQDRLFNAFFFLFHYGFFQLVHLIFIRPAAFPGVFTAIGFCVIAFALSHAYSLWRNIRRDRVQAADFSTLFWLPYARVIPMHLTIILGPQLAGGEYALLLFLGLKTLADLAMHVVEHRVLRQGSR